MTREDWINKCSYWKNKWPTITTEHITDSNNGIDIYAVLNSVNEYSQPSDIIVGDAGSISYAGPVALKAKKNQRLIFSPAQADMGWALPGAIGISLVNNDNVIAITGDGSFMSNLQELAVVSQHNLNIKVVILNNKGYLSIKNTQTKYFEGRVFGTDSNSGLWFPNFLDIAKSFNMNYVQITQNSELKCFENIFKTQGSYIIDVICKHEQEILPAQALKNGKQAGLHDMTPFLSDEELNQEMIVKI